MFPFQGEATFAINPDGVGDARDWELFEDFLSEALLCKSSLVRKFASVICSVLYILTGIKQLTVLAIIPVNMNKHFPQYLTGKRRRKTSQEMRMLSLSLFIQGSLWLFRVLFSIVRNVISVSKVTMSLSLSLSLSLLLSFCWSGHVSSSFWSNVSKVTRL